MGVGRGADAADGIAFGAATVLRVHCPLRPNPFGAATVLRVLRTLAGGSFMSSPSGSSHSDAGADVGVGQGADVGVGQGADVIAFPGSCSFMSFA